MMDGLISAGLLNAALATLLAGVAIAVTAAWKNPYVARLAWLAVLLKLLTPPLLFVPVEVAWLQPSVPSTLTVAVESVAIEPNDSQPVANNVDISAATTEALTTSTTTQAIATPVAPATTPTAPLLAPAPYSFPFTPLQTLAAIWLTGSVLLGLLALTRIVRLHRWLARSLPCPTTLEQRTAALAAELGLHAPPRVCIVAGRVAPFAWSLGRRATIVLPAALVDSLDADALDAVIAHELTHLRRHDGWARWLELAATIAYWWCPTAWFARRRLHAAEEECCDADVLRKFPTLRRGYGQALLQTLDLLAGDAPLAPGATGWGSRRSLRRRFERIGTPSLVQPLPKWSRVFYGAAIIVTCLLAPAAATSEPATSEAAPEAAPETKETTEPIADNSEPCTITLKDGSVINGVLINNNGERRVVLGEQEVPGTPSQQAATLSPTTDPESLQLWDLKLEECIEIALTNLRSCNLSSKPNDLGRFEIIQAPWSRKQPRDFQSELEATVRDIAEAYWELHFAWEDLAAKRAAQRSALATWRRIMAKHRGADPQKNDAGVSQSRDAFFAIRSQVETAQTHLLRTEHRLRYVMRLAKDDGRAICPADRPDASKRSIDPSLSVVKALANREEIYVQKAKLQKAREHQAEAQKAVVKTDQPALGDQLKATIARHAVLLAARESAVLQDVELGIVHQIHDAARDIDSAYEAIQTSQRQKNLAVAEAVDANKHYDEDRASLGLVLQANQRRADATSLYQRALADYARATMQLEVRQGTLLEAHRLSIAE
ncbi:M56 family metallopeptidase [Lacipirellula parvula]|uniref:Peptidase M56 domain-containing protein n=1 Tax=Lacipirellula parvula TaxID=2650471 RepID=A0A5K7XN95_9BACT|nr:M56 family metallopeptidase [Lacipirellula parvula]BBO36486.1 hypothetical protein PLANPX_6098 [Lacipirellula parvula]